jgi:SAM-dependent methyltransferase
MTPRALITVLCALIAAPLAASAASKDIYFDVPYVATPPAVVSTMLKLAGATPNDVVYDLGSGDGRIVIAAARDFKVKKGVGIDLDPELVNLATKNAKEAGVSDRVSFARGDIFKMDFKDATILTLYLLPDVNVTLRPRILDLTPGTRVVSHAFNMGDWVPDGADNVDMRRVYLWIVPAKVQGVWTAAADGVPYRLELDQRYQNAGGKVKVGAKETAFEMGIVKSDVFTFTGAGPITFDGKVKGDTMTGTLTAGGKRTPVTFTREQK